jgi:hypothetical protein
MLDRFAARCRSTRTVLHVPLALALGLLLLLLVFPRLHRLTLASRALVELLFGPQTGELALGMLDVGLALLAQGSRGVAKRLLSRLECLLTGNVLVCDEV